MVSADALFAASHQAEAEQPLVKADLGALKDGADSDREGLAALVALEDAGARRFALELGDILDAAAMRANGAFGPEHRFEMHAGLVGVVVDRIGKVEHSKAPC